MTTAAGSRRALPHVLARRATIVGSLLCAAVAWAAGGTDGLVSALLATVIVVGFFWTGLLPLRITRGLESRAGVGLGVLLLTYTLRLAVVLMVLRLAQRAEFLDERWLGVTIIFGALTWTVVHLVGNGPGQSRIRGARRE